MNWSAGNSWVWIPSAMQCQEVLDWTHWNALDCGEFQSGRSIIHRFLLHHVISCADCAEDVEPDDDPRSHIRESHMAQGECDWCVGEWRNHTRFSSPSLLQPTQGRSQWLPLSPDSSSWNQLKWRLLCATREPPWAHHLNTCQLWLCVGKPKRSHSSRQPETNLEVWWYNWLSICWKITWKKFFSFQQLTVHFCVL